MTSELKINYPQKIFVTGIGTDVGKSYATGWLAKEMISQGINVMTQKFIQTGNNDFSEDIERHRKIMGIEFQTLDIDHTTAPIIFTYPASPHLAAHIDNKSINLETIDKATEKILSTYSHVLIEGAGGLMVPITEDYLTIDYIKDRSLPTLLVVTGQLGSINHALLSLEALKQRNINLFALIYNPFFDKDRIICDDTRNYLKSYLKKHFPDSIYMEMPENVN